MKEHLTQVESLQNLLISRATGNQESNAEFTQLRKIILENTALDVFIPKIY